MFLGGGGAVGLGEGRVKLISTLAVRNGEKSDGARYDKSLGFWVRFLDQEICHWSAKRREKGRG